MNLFNIINSSDFGGLRASGSQESSGPIPKGRAFVRRSARPRSNHPSPSTSRSDTSRPAKARAGRTNGVTKHRPGSRATEPDRGKRVTLQSKRHGEARAAAPNGVHTSSSSSRSRSTHKRTQPQEPPTRERIQRARAAADLTSMGRGKQVSIMDVILDSQAPTARLDAEDLIDAIEQYQCIAFARPSAEDDLLADMFVPGRYEARQVAFWWDVRAALEYSPKSIYHVSAERSTAAWDTASDSGSSEPL